MSKLKTLSVVNVVSGLFFALSFIVLPFFLSLLILFCAISFNQLKKLQIEKVAANTIAAYLALINSTKIPASDMVNYLARFEEVPEATLLNYLFGGDESKEPFYSLLNYVGYYFTFGSFQFFIFLVSFMIFSLQFSALRRYCWYYNVSSQRFFLCCLSLGMFNSYFSLTGHLIRQCLALSVLMYILVAGCTSVKLKRWLFVFPVFIHSIALFFSPIILIKGFNEAIRFTTILKLLFAFLLLYFGYEIVLSIAMSLFEPIGFIVYILSRVDNPSGFIELAEVSNQAFMEIVATVILLYTSFFLFFTKYKLNPLIGHAIILSCLLTLSFSEYSLLQYRIFFILYGFVPYLLISIPELHHRLGSGAAFVTYVTVYSIFLHEVENGAWDYASTMDLTMNNPLTLILKYWS